MKDPLKKSSRNESKKKLHSERKNEKKPKESTRRKQYSVYIKRQNI
jgi:hypothetical protein